VTTSYDRLPTLEPLWPALARSTVSVAHGAEPYWNTRRALESVDLSPVQGKRVLLKPNVGRVAPCESGIVTHRDVVAAAIDCFREAGADVAIGESPIVGVKVLEAFEAAGITAVANDRDCPLIDMDRRRCVDVELPEGRAIHSIRVCEDVFDFDLVVSIPVMKMHMHTGATLAVKNMKGCLWRRSKVELHMLPPIDEIDAKPIDVAIADMSGVLRPHLSIIDGTVGMEGLGPSAGKPKRLGVVVVGTDAFAADAVACRLMGTRAEQIPHLRIGAERGYGTIDLEHVDVSPDGWQEWSKPFAAPPENLTIEFPNVTVLDNNSCSACQSTLLLFLKKNQDHLFDYLPKDRPLRIAIGKGHQELPEGTLCLGNCTINRRGQGIFVPGCPPVGSEILKAIREGRINDECRKPNDE
jgi:uncharacterized protein (DUF362 family)